MANLEIRQSPWRMLGLIGLGVVMTTGSAAIALRRLPGIAPGSFHEFVGYAGTALFSLATVVATWRLLAERGAVITVSEDGIHDRRLSPNVIPWRAISGISTWQYRRQRMMVLAIDPAAEATLALTRMARWSRGPNRSLGIDGLCVATVGLATDYDTLLEECQRALAQARSAQTPA